MATGRSATKPAGSTFDRKPFGGDLVAVFFECCLQFPPLLSHSGQKVAKFFCISYRFATEGCHHVGDGVQAPAVGSEFLTGGLVLWTYAEYVIFALLKGLSAQVPASEANVGVCAACIGGLLAL